MEESVAYQLIIEQGEIKGERKMLLRVGRKRLGEPPPEIAAYVNALEDRDLLLALAERATEVSSWGELLAFAIKHSS